MILKRFTAAAALLLAAVPLSALGAESGLRLSLPIDCHYGRDCFIQNYVDTDPTSGYKDHRCGNLTYDKHTGTDFRLRNLKEMRAGVTVLAAASGTVRATRDGMRDQSIREGGKAAVRDRECGNGVVIQHTDGWETQYCHLRNGSIHVKKGQMVKAGGKLALVGLSGETEFPHVHFAVRKAGGVIDPFTGLTAPPASQGGLPSLKGCRYDSAMESGSLWSEAAHKTLQYIPSALIGAGFSGIAPDAKAAAEGEYDAPSLPRNSKVLAFWAELIGLQAGDKLVLEIVSPSGETLARQEKEIPSPKAQMFAFIGKRYEAGNIPTGIYQGKLTLLRKSDVAISEETRTIIIH